VRRQTIINKGNCPRKKAGDRQLRKRPGRLQKGIWSSGRRTGGLAGVVTATAAEESSPGAARARLREWRVPMRQVKAANTLHTLRVGCAPISGRRVRFVFRQQMPSPESQRLAHNESSSGRTCCDFARFRSPGAALVRCSICVRSLCSCQRPSDSAGGMFVLCTRAHVDTMPSA
jgi:hypothetical protein